MIGTRCPQNCATTAVAKSLGGGRGPTVRVCVEQVKFWRKLLHTQPSARAAIADTWHRSRPRIANPGTKWLQVHGPVGAM
eukprot:9112060-Alexandrium_andersonii.AAC.1